MADTAVTAQEGPVGQLLLKSLSGVCSKVVCPSEDELGIEEGCVCPVEGCSKEFKGSSQMQMHLVRHHKGHKLEGMPSDTSNCAYYCPVAGCLRGKENGRPFPRLGQLKQHYQTVHGKKDHVCQKCGKGFALKDQCNRHESECGQTFTCGTCSDTFRTRNGLYMHVKRKKHKLPEGVKPRKTASSQPPNLMAILHSPTQTSKLIEMIPLTVSPIVVRQVVQLPRQVAQSTQTCQTDKTFGALKTTASQTDQESGPISSHQSQSFTQQNYTHLNINKSPFSLQHSTVGTTQLQDSTTTQTEHHHLSCITDDLLSLGTQTMDLTFTQGSQTRLTSSCEFGTQTSTYKTAPDPCSTASSELQCLQYDLNTLGLVDFGTQTSTHRSSQDPPDNSNINSSEVSDFGTQTIFLPNLDSMESALSYSTDQDALNLLPPECMDFGTQTRESELDSITCFDFGVQTALDFLSSSDTKDQGCQT